MTAEMSIPCEANRARICLAPKAQHLLKALGNAQVLVKENSLALKARFTFSTRSINIDSRFQRVFLGNNFFLGRCPRFK
jgi:hypothetical protein